MDPTFAPGELGVVTNLDLRAFDVLGFNSTAVPEPTSIAIFGGSMVILSLARRKRS
ncbi:MAG: PEP-CTERM sorting domain-containing protein [Pirellula sp.]